MQIYKLNENDWLTIKAIIAEIPITEILMEKTKNITDPQYKYFLFVLLQ